MPSHSFPPCGWAARSWCGCDRRRTSARFAAAGRERMGPPMMRRPPKYCNGFIDRHGKARWYFRRAGFKKVPLPGLPWSPEFMAAYEQALAGQPAPIGAERTIPGTLRALAVSYFNSPDFRSLKPSSQAIYRGIIDRLCIQYGDNRIANL